MTSVSLKGFRIDKDGKLKKVEPKRSVSERIREKKSKRVRPIKKIGD